MTKRSLALSVCVLVALPVIAGSRAEAADNWIGVWTANLAKSKYTPGPAPKEWTLTFERTADGSTKLTSAGVSGQGQQQSMTFTSKFDGTEVPWAGNPDADACAPLRMSDTLYVNISKKGGKLLMITRVEVSGDGKSLTVTQAGTIDNRVVYERKR
jgi:hypothetical protein